MPFLLLEDIFVYQQLITLKDGVMCLGVCVAAGDRHAATDVATLTSCRPRKGEGRYQPQ